ncbi:MAG: hypothetical protein LBM01_03615 [Christensenellaceae bacterium]|jgi:hypothetical protein|nr:hypothetical protein [Christensenellaceae bacterium]
MKKFKNFAMVLVIVFAIPLLLTACGKNNDDDKKTTDPDPTPVAVKLSAPAGLSISGSTLTWGEVANASSYTVKISGTSDTTGLTTATLDLSTKVSAAGYYNIQVMAIGNGTTYLNSDLSAVEVYEYTTTENLTAAQMSALIFPEGAEPTTITKTGILFSNEFGVNITYVNYDSEGDIYDFYDADYGLDGAGNSVSRIQYNIDGYPYAYGAESGDFGLGNGDVAILYINRKNVFEKSVAEGWVSEMQKITYPDGSYDVILNGILEAYNAELNDDNSNGLVACYLYKFNSDDELYEVIINEYDETYNEPDTEFPNALQQTKITALFEDVVLPNGEKESPFPVITFSSFVDLQKLVVGETYYMTLILQSAAEFSDGFETTIEAGAYDVAFWSEFVNYTLRVYSNADFETGEITAKSPYVYTLNVAENAPTTYYFTLTLDAVNNGDFGAFIPEIMPTQ